MLEFFQQFGEWLGLIVDGIVMVFKSMFQFISMIPAWVTLLTGVETQLPVVIAPFIIMGITVSVVLLIVGRI